NKILKWKDDGILDPAFLPDNPPEFNTDVMVGRLLLDSPMAVESTLQTIMNNEQDGGIWKSRTLLAGAMLSVGGRTWDVDDNEYKDLAAPTDTGYLMEAVWNDFLSPGGYSRIRLYEKESPYGVLPPRTSAFAVDDPLSMDSFSNWWSAQAYGLIKLSGHGCPQLVVRHMWREDENSNSIPEEVISPDEGVSFPYELAEKNLFYSDQISQLAMPGGKTPVLIALSCSTGGWNAYSNIATELLAAGKISAWVGGTDKLYYVPGWQNPFDSTGGRGQTIDYLITGHLIGDEMSLGDSVWTGLKDYYWWANVSNWTGSDINLGFLSWDLYGDPSMGYWGDGADTTAPWPMFQYDWPGGGETALLGPDGLGTDEVGIGWTAPISAPLVREYTPSPVIGQNGVVVIGDGNGVVRAVNPDGTKLWSFQTGGAISNAAALSRDGVVYVKAGDGKLYAINDQGALLWSRQVGESNASPKIGADGTIYVGGSDNNGTGGSKRYFLVRYRPDGMFKGLTQVDGIVTTTPSVTKEGWSVWVGTDTGRIYWMIPGLIGFSHHLTPGSPIGNGLALSNEHELLIVPSANSSVKAFDTGDFQVSWTYSTTAPVVSAPALGANGQVFFGSQDGVLYALDVATGAELWSKNIGGTIDSSPALDPLNVFVVGGDPAAVVAFRRSDGAYRWSVPLGGSAAGGSSPALGPSRVLYVAAPSSVGGVGGDGALLALSQSSWTMPPFIKDFKPETRQNRLVLGLNDLTAMTQVERRLPGGEWQPLGKAEPGILEFIDRDILPGQTYEYRAIAIQAGRSSSDGSGLLLEPSEYSAPVTVQALPDLPEEPQEPVVTPLSSTGLLITWTLEMANAVNIEVIRQNPGEVLTESIALLPGDVNAYDDTALDPSSEYHYWLRANNLAGQSPLSKMGSGTTLPQTLPPPENVIVNPLDSSTMEVCWTPGDEAVPSVVARRTFGLTELEPLDTLSPGETCYTDDFAENYMFEYWVKHRDEAGTNESDWARSALTASLGFDLGYQKIYLPLVLRN
ncbi:MAG: PQQ-binding-like beta-propeller repeat protein, partial [Anaerolineales bacterium]|nr:PQQ-binding-like beta-propeller repeat protein [Anaerolineales bacterium]